MNESEFSLLQAKELVEWEQIKKITDFANYLKKFKEIKKTAVIRTVHKYLKNPVIIVVS